MKRLVIALSILLLTISTFAQDSTKNVFWSMRVKVKMDKTAEFEKKLPVLLTTHFPTMSFRVYETLTGPNTGTYVLISGPYSFKEFDVPNLSPKGEATQKADIQALNALFDSREVQYGRVVTDAGIPNPTREIKYINVTEREFESGDWTEYLSILKKIRAAREKGGAKIDVAYYRPAAGGNQNTFLTSRFFSKWEDLDTFENLAEMYDNAHGRAAWSRDLEKLNAMTKSVKSEVRVLRKDLSSTGQPAAK